MRNLLTILLGISLFLCANANAQTLQDELNKLAALRQDVQDVEQANQDIASNVTKLNTEIEAIKAKPSAESLQLLEARTKLESAEQTVASDPSQVNQDRLEQAQFKLKLAERRDRKSNPGPTELITEKAELEQALEGNQKQLSRLNGRIQSQQQLIDSMEQQSKKAQENAKQARIAEAAAKEQALTESQDELAKTRAEHEKAMAEIAALKQQLEAREAAEAAEEAKEAAAAEVAIVAAVASAEANEPASQAVPAPPEAAEPNAEPQTQPQQTKNSAPFELLLDKASAQQRYAELKKLASSGSARGSNKIAHVKTYKDGDLIKRSSHSLASKGNAQYLARLNMRAGETQVKISREEWVVEVPESEDGKRYSLWLDGSGEEARIILFATGLID
ncbi:MAG: hypothetical protein V7711_14945 [Pseudomonadales bacterium]